MSRPSEQVIIGYRSLIFNVIDSSSFLISGTLTPDEWEVAYLYLAFVLRKVIGTLRILRFVV